MNKSNSLLIYLVLSMLTLNACNNSDSGEKSKAEAANNEAMRIDSVEETTVEETTVEVIGSLDERYSNSSTFAGIGFISEHRERILEIADEDVYKYIYRFFELTSDYVNYPTYPVKVEDGKVFFYGGDKNKFVAIIVDVKPDKFYICIRENGQYHFYKDDTELFFPEKLLEKTGFVSMDENGKLTVAKKNILDEMYGLSSIKFSHNRYSNKLHKLKDWGEIDKIKLFWNGKKVDTGYGPLTPTNTQYGFYNDNLVYIYFILENSYESKNFLNFALENFGPHELSYEGEANSRSLYKFTGEKVTCIITTHKNSDKVNVQLMETTIVKRAAPHLLVTNQMNS